MFVPVTFDRDLTVLEYNFVFDYLYLQTVKKSFYMIMCATY